MLAFAKVYLFLFNTFDCNSLGSVFVSGDISVAKLTVAQQFPNRIFVIKVSIVTKIPALPMRRRCHKATALLGGGDGGV